MKVLLVNKYLYPKGGAETYVMKLGSYLQKMGHDVQYFGMDHSARCVGNEAGMYVREIDFHNSAPLVRLTYPFRIIYSQEARKKIRKVLDVFQPDVCHLNNFNYQLTPSIILEIRKWEKETNRTCKIVYTAHDYQLICPNHLCLNPNNHRVCEKCLSGDFWNCAKGRCIHGSFLRSVLGSVEALFWKKKDIYKQIDSIICISRFVQEKISTNPVLKEKAILLHNFVEPATIENVEKKNYVFFFGRYSQEKGIASLVKVAEELQDIPFVFAGAGPLEGKLAGVPNITNLGFLSGEELIQHIQEAKFTVCPSEWYEPFGLTVTESITNGTPVLGANIGGIPEIIEDKITGQLFEAGNVQDLKDQIWKLYCDDNTVATYSHNCTNANFISIQAYVDRLIQIYQL